MIVSPSELQAVKDGLDHNARNAGLGILHEPSDRVFLAPFDSVPGGHAELAMQSGLPLHECKGFLIGKDTHGDYVLVNNSHLNGLQGQPGALRMPQTTFDAIEQALRNAGL